MIPLPAQILEAKISFNKAEAGELIHLLDRVTRAEGLAAAHMAGYFFKKIDEAFKAKPLGENQNGNKDSSSS